MCRTTLANPAALLVADLLGTDVRFTVHAHDLFADNDTLAMKAHRTRFVTAISNRWMFITGWQAIVRRAELRALPDYDDLVANRRFQASFGRDYAAALTVHPPVAASTTFIVQDWHSPALSEANSCSRRRVAM